MIVHLVAQDTWHGANLAEKTDEIEGETVVIIDDERHGVAVAVVCMGFRQQAQPDCYKSGFEWKLEAKQYISRDVSSI